MYSLLSAQSVNSDSAWVLTLIAKTLSRQILMVANLICLQHLSIRTIYVKMSWFSSRTFMRKARRCRNIYSKKRKVTDMHSHSNLQQRFRCTCFSAFTILKQGTLWNVQTHFFTWTSYKVTISINCGNKE